MERREERRRNCDDQRARSALTYQGIKENKNQVKMKLESMCVCNVSMSASSPGRVSMKLSAWLVWAGRLDSEADLVSSSHFFLKFKGSFEYSSLKSFPLLTYYLFIASKCPIFYKLFNF